MLLQNMVAGAVDIRLRRVHISRNRQSRSFWIVSTGYSENSSLRRAQTIADYQFGSGAGTGLFPEGCTFIFSTTGRIRQILFEGVRLATVRASDGRLTLGIEGAKRLKSLLPSPVTGWLSVTMSQCLWHRERMPLQNMLLRLILKSAREMMCLSLPAMTA